MNLLKRKDTLRFDFSLLLLCFFLFVFTMSHFQDAVALTTSITGTKKHCLRNPVCFRL